MNFPEPDEGPAKGMFVSAEEFQVGLDDYYSARGWTADGVPTTEKLKALDLGDLAYITEKANTVGT